MPKPCEVCVLRLLPWSPASLPSQLPCQREGLPGSVRAESPERVPDANPRPASQLRDFRSPFTLELVPSLCDLRELEESTWYFHYQGLKSRHRVLAPGPLAAASLVRRGRCAGSSHRSSVHFASQLTPGPDAASFPEA